MRLNIAKESAALDNLSISELRQRYEELFQEKTTVHNRQWLKRRILWRMQVNEEGDLSTRARQRALEIANDSDLRMSPPKSHSITSITKVFHNRKDKRLPLPGSTISKLYKGQAIEVLVKEEGFEYAGEHFNSLSSVAEKVSGSHQNGFLFFGLTKKTVAK